MISKRDVLIGGSAVLGAGVLTRPAAAAGTVVRMPIAIHSNGMPLLKITISGKGPYRFLIDTGSFTSLIREPLAIELGLSKAGTIRTGSLTGHEDSYLYVAQNLVLGGGFKVPRMSLVGLANFPIVDVDGVLPASILTFVPSQLDYEASEIRYYLNGAEMDLTGFDKVPAFFEADGEGGAEKVYVYATVGGAKLVLCLDTGASSTFYLSAATVGRLKLWDKYPLLAEGVNVGANSERVRSRRVMAETLSVGTLPIERMPITLADPSASDSLGGRSLDGLLGTPFLRRFTVAFGPDKTLYLKPNALFAYISSEVPDMFAPEAVPSTPDKPVLPFVYTNGRSILFPGFAGDRPPFPCRLNTSRARSSINPRWAAELGATALPTGDFSSAGIGIAGVHLPKLTFKPNPARALGIELGLDFLTALPSALNFDNNQMTFFIGATPEVDGYTQMAVERKPYGDGENRLFITMQLEGQPVSCLIDTSQSSALFLTAAMVKARSLWSKYPDAQNRLFFLDDGGIVKARYVHMKGASIGPFRFDDVPTTLSDPTDASVEFAGIDAVIGMGFLHRFNIVFVKDGSVWFKPNSYIGAK
jgi:predicted aspartyl protease